LGATKQNETKQNKTKQNKQKERKTDPGMSSVHQLQKCECDNHKRENKGKTNPLQTGRISNGFKVTIQFLRRHYNSFTESFTIRMLPQLLKNTSAQNR
jgi:hypothetical protein